MIFTCTMNPSLDYYMEFDERLKSGVPNRSSLEYYEAGGKGINVSIVLNNLGIPSSAFGFVGGFTKDFYIKLLSKYEEIRPNFTYIDGHTRINIKASSDIHTDLNASGPVITDKNMKNLAAKVERLTDGDYLILAGVTQDYLYDDVIDMLAKASKDNVRIILDTNADLMKRMLEYKPFMIKTTPKELGMMYDETPETREEIIALGKRLVAEGCGYVMIVIDNAEALFIYEGNVFASQLVDSDNKALSMVGTGDSLVAGFLMNYLRTSDAADSFRFASCCGSATAYSKGLATREKIDAIYETLELEKIE